jgi:aarF domain-containing kinase
LEQQQSKTRILASSTALTKEERRFVRRLLDWLQHVLRSLYETTTVVLRSAEVALRFSPLIILTPTAMLTSSLLPDDRDNPISELAWWHTIKSLQALGPCFVKLAQWIATRRDIFPPVLCGK